MSTPHESAQSLMQLYEIRRETRLREARAWVVSSFNPRSVEDYLAIMKSDEYVNVRMVTSYWEMAASFVVHGAIDAEMFQAVSGEMLVVLAKVDFMLDEIREATGQTGALRHVEKVASEWPGSAERMVGMREYFWGMADAS
jgi:hypothetical protein